MLPPALPTRAAIETAIAHGITPDRCDVLQNGHTLVLRLTDTLVARVVTDNEGPRQGGEWFSREIAIARHLTENAAPVIPLHPDIPPVPHEHLGYTMNFWEFVTKTNTQPTPAETGTTLGQCHEILESFPGTLPRLAIIHETHALLDTLARRDLFPAETLRLLEKHLVHAIGQLSPLPHQPLHGDAHGGNLLPTTRGLLWTDWEDAFLGPVEWDLASIIWNAKLLENDTPTVSGILSAYTETRGPIDENALDVCLVARAAVMSAWYPILYPDLDATRVAKLKHRLKWLEEMKPG